MSYHSLDEYTSDLLVSAIDEGRTDEVKAIAEQADGVQLASFLLASSAVHRKGLLKHIPDELMSEVLVHLVPGLRREIVSTLGIEKVASLLTSLDSEDVMIVVEDLDSEQQERILALLPEEMSMLITERFSYPEKSAGRLMHRDITVVPAYWTIGQLENFLRANAKQERRLHEIFVTNPKLQPIGVLSAEDVILSNRECLIGAVMDTDVKVIPLHANQEEVSEIFRKYSILSAPVVDKEGRVIGAVLVHDIIDVVHEEAGEDVLHLGMVSDGDISSPIVKTVTKRLPWLLVNLLTSTVSSLVIGLFSDTIKSFIALSVIMPMIASMSGNSGLQALTVTIRALATKQLTYRNSRRLLFKELCIGMINGAVLAAIASIAVVIRFHDVSIEVLFAISMITTFSMATLSGAAVPMLLNFIGADPAVSSSIIVCAASDILSFLIFLGLATIFLM